MTATTGGARLVGVSRRTSSTIEDGGTDERCAPEAATVTGAAATEAEPDFVGMVNLPGFITSLVAVDLGADATGAVLMLVLLEESGIIIRVSNELVSTYS
jgi:hypothetical protein